MNNRFTLPIALAVAAHAALLAGFRHGPAVIRVPVKETKIPADPIRMPPEIEIIDYHSSSEAPKGSPNPARPEIEPVDRLPRLTDIPMDSTPPSLLPRIDPGIPSFEPPGKPDGI